ncbi:hypothetical protein Tco_0765416 [Tanacetum coccineum]
MANPPPPNHAADLPKDELATQDNINGWLEEDDEDEMEVEEDDEMNDEIEDDVDDAEIINPYEEADPLNKPPPDSDFEPKTTTTPVGHATLQLLPPIRRFLGTFYVGEGSSATTFTADNCTVSAPGPLGKNLGALHSKVKTLAKQMKDREEILKHSKMVQLIEGLSRQFQELRKQEYVRAENRELIEMLRIAQERVKYHRETAEYHCYRLA